MPIKLGEIALWAEAVEEQARALSPQDFAATLATLAL